MHAAVGTLGLGEIALLHGQAAEIIARHGADLIQLADQEIGQWLLRLGCRLVGGLMAPALIGLMRLMHGLMRLVSALLRGLVSAMMRWLMGGLRCRLHRCSFRCLAGGETTLFEFEQLRHRGKFGFQVFEPAFMLGSDLLHELLELSLVSIDLLFK